MEKQRWGDIEKRRVEIDREMVRMTEERGRNREKREGE